MFQPPRWKHPNMCVWNLRLVEQSENQLQASICWGAVAVGKTLEHADEISDCPCLLVAVLQGLWRLRRGIKPLNSLD